MLLQLERTRLALIDNVVLANNPLSVAGAALFFQNNSDVDQTITIEHSDDGTTYETLGFTTIATSYSTTTLTLVAKAGAVILLASAKAYVRINTTATTPDTLYVDILQFVK